MRIWSLHPRYLDSTGLVALWRETLLAQAVLRGETRGYTRHPQLTRFREQDAPAASVAEYLRGVHEEATARGYRFDVSKIGDERATAPLVVTTGQLAFEWRHLLAKLRTRAPAQYERVCDISTPDAHPLFRVIRGNVADWERGTEPA